MRLNKPAKNLRSRGEPKYFDDIGPFSRRIGVKAQRTKILDDERRKAGGPEKGMLGAVTVEMPEGQETGSARTAALTCPQPSPRIGAHTRWEISISRK
jgi:hypothetical protein